MNDSATGKPLRTITDDEALRIAVETLVADVGGVGRTNNYAGVASGFFVDTLGYVLNKKHRAPCHGFMGGVTHFPQSKLKAAAVWSTWLPETKQAHLEWCRWLTLGTHPWRRLFPDGDLQKVQVGDYYPYTAEFMHEYGFVFTELHKFPCRYYMNFFIASRFFLEQSIRVPLYEELVVRGFDPAVVHAVSMFFSKFSDISKDGYVYKAYEGLYYPLDIGNAETLKRFVSGTHSTPRKTTAPYSERQRYQKINTMWGKSWFSGMFGFSWDRVHHALQSAGCSWSSYGYKIYQTVDIANHIVEVYPEYAPKT